MHLQTSLLLLLGLSAPLAFSQILQIVRSPDDENSCAIYADDVAGCDDSYSEPFGTTGGTDDSRCSLDNKAPSICDTGLFRLGGSGCQSQPLIFYGASETWKCNVGDLDIDEECTPTLAPAPSETA